MTRTIKIVSGGTPATTCVYDDQGDKLAGVSGIRWEATDFHAPCRAEIEFMFAEVEIEGITDSEPPKVQILAAEVDAVRDFLKRIRS